MATPSPWRQRRRRIHTYRRAIMKPRVAPIMRRRPARMKGFRFPTLSVATPAKGWEKAKRKP